MAQDDGKVRFHSVTSIVESSQSNSYGELSTCKKELGRGKVEDMVENSAQKISRFKYAVISVFGFGIGGLLWGLEAYRGTVGSGEVFTNPFSYVLGAVAIAVFGGVALAYSQEQKKTFKIIIFGLVGWLAAFFVPAVWVEWVFLVGAGIIQPLFFALSYTGIDFTTLVNLQPSLVVTGLWLEFFITGAIIGVVYALILKTKAIKTALWAGIGFALAAIIGPIIGNLIGDLFGSLLISYLVTFLVIGKMFGVFLGRSL